MSRLQLELSNVKFHDCLETMQYLARHKGKRVNVFLSFIPFRNGCIDISSFLDLIKDQIIVRFVISFKEIQKHYQRKDKIVAERDLFRKAVRKITRSTAKGKLGELLLYLFLEQNFSAPKIISKISNLTDSNDQVKGADAVHAQYLEGTLVLYLGESKLWQNYGGACSRAIRSIKATLKDYSEEFDLIETNIDFPNISDDLEREILNILNPYTSNGNLPVIHSPCFIGFNSDICQGIKSASDYKNKYLSAAQEKIDTFYTKAAAHFDLKNISLILLPFESIDSFTDQFIRKMGIRS